MKTSNKILITFLTAIFLLAYGSLLINHMKYKKSEKYRKQICQDFAQAKLKVIYFSGDFNPMSVVLSTTPKQIELGFPPLPETIHIKSDTLFISSPHKFKIQLPDIKHFIINGDIHNIFTPPLLPEKLYKSESEK